MTNPMPPPATPYRCPTYCLPRCNAKCHEGHRVAARRKHNAIECRKKVEAAERQSQEDDNPFAGVPCAECGAFRMVFRDRRLGCTACHAGLPEMADSNG